MKKKEVINRIITVFVILLSTAILCVGIIPRIAGYTGYYVNSDSMKPAIPKGSLVFDKEVAFEEINNGDVITFKKADSTKWFSHRVIEINEKGKSFVTKGDNNNISDPLSTKYNYVVGRVEFSIPIIGYISMFLDKTYGKIIVSLMFVAYIASEIEIFSSKKKGRDAQ